MYLHGYEYGRRTFRGAEVDGTDVVSCPLVVVGMNTSSVELVGFATRVLITLLFLYKN
jgi:hypothetical protein